MALENGYVRPVFHTTDQYGNHVAGFTEDDLRRIHQGRNCWNCQEPFGGLIPVKCPVCRESQATLPTNVEQPAEWR